ncbi:transcriptional regulator, partial [Burkholderia cenocepacia]
MNQPSSSPGPPLDATPRRALGESPRAHRERLSPQAVGRPPGPPRPTSGPPRRQSLP